MTGKLAAYQDELNDAAAIDVALVGSNHYASRERSRGWSAVFAAVAFGCMALAVLGYVVAMQLCAAQLPAWVR